MAYGRLVTITLTLVAVGLATACTSTQKPQTEILGLRVGMEKSAAQSRLREISELVRKERKNQEIWQMNDTSQFNSVAVGYNGDDKIRYVTAFVDKEQATEHVSFTSVGDLSTAKAEITEPHYRYIWEIPASDGSPASSIVAYGDNPDFVTIYSLVAKHNSVKPIEPEEGEKY